MEVKVNVEGVEAVVSVKDADEAASLLASLARSRSAPPSPSTPPVSTENGEDEVTDDTMLLVLRDLKGSESSKILKTMAAHPNGCRDEVIKKALGITNMGPRLANITRACKKQEITKEAIFTQQDKRGEKGKIIYFYRLTPQALRLIGTIPDFDKQEEFPGFDDSESVEK